MKLTIFGATGRTGLEVVKQAVTRGYDVTAFVRSPEKLGDLQKQVTVVQGDILNAQEVERAVAGSDAVISAIGPTKDSAAGFQPQATQAIVDGMKRAGVKRLVTMTGAGVRTDTDTPKFIDKAIVKIMNIIAARILDDGIGHADVVRNSGLDWTIVRAPVLKDGPAKGSYATGKVGDAHLAMSINRADVASFILDIATTGKHLGEMPLVADPK